MTDSMYEVSMYLKANGKQANRVIVDANVSVGKKTMHEILFKSDC